MRSCTGSSMPSVSALCVASLIVAFTQTTLGCISVCAMDVSLGCSRRVLVFFGASPVFAFTMICNSKFRGCLHTAMPLTHSGAHSIDAQHATQKAELLQNLIPHCFFHVLTPVLLWVRYSLLHQGCTTIPKEGKSNGSMCLSPTCQPKFLRRTFYPNLF